MDLTEEQRIIIANTIQGVLGEAQQKMKQYLKEQRVSCDNMEQANNYDTFAGSYFYNLREQAPSSLQLIDFKHS